MIKIIRFLAVVSMLVLPAVLYEFVSPWWLILYAPEAVILFIKAIKTESRVDWIYGDNDEDL